MRSEAEDFALSFKNLTLDWLPWVDCSLTTFVESLGMIDCSNHFDLSRCSRRLKFWRCRRFSSSSLVRLSVVTSALVSMLSEASSCFEGTIFAEKVQPVEFCVSTTVWSPIGNQFKFLVAVKRCFVSVVPLFRRPLLSTAMRSDCQLWDLKPCSEVELGLWTYLDFPVLER